MNVLIKKLITTALMLTYALCLPVRAEESAPAVTPKPVLMDTPAAVPAPEVESPAPQATHDPLPDPSYTIFDDKMLLDGYAQKYADEPKDIILERIKDETLSPYMTAAAVRVFREKFSAEIVGKEKIIIEKVLLRRLDRTDSTFVEVEIMHTLVLMDRYKYFKSMVPALILKMDHYNSTVDELAFNSLNNIAQTGHGRAREARIVFNALRKVLFLSRKRIASVKEPGIKLKQKLELLRWAIKILGSEELQKLPKEVIGFL